MPGTLEALIIALVFVMPGFITARTREMLVPTVGKPEALQITLRSITVSLLYLPLWLLASPHLFALRTRITQGPALATGLPMRPTVMFLALSLILPVCVGFVWAIASWNGWYPRFVSRIYPRLGLRAPLHGVGEDLWDKLWFNRSKQPWLTVYMKDGRIYIGRGVEFSQSSYGQDLLLGPDTKIYKDGEEKKDLATSAGEGVWIPGREVTSIDIHQ